MSRVLSDAVTQLVARNSTYYFVRTVMSETVELIVMVTCIYPAVSLCFIQIFGVWCLFLITCLEGKNKYMGLFMMKQIA